MGPDKRMREGTGQEKSDQDDQKPSRTALKLYFEQFKYIINILNCIPRLSRPFFVLFNVYMSHCGTAGNDISRFLDV